MTDRGHGEKRSAVIACVDHRAAFPAHANIRSRHQDGDDHEADIITAPGPERFDPKHPQSRQFSRRSLAHVLNAARIVHEAHGVDNIDFTSHRGCAANPADPEVQDASTRRAAHRLETALRREGLAITVHPQVAERHRDGTHMITSLERIAPVPVSKKKRRAI